MSNLRKPGLIALATLGGILVLVTLGQLGFRYWFPITVLLMITGLVAIVRSDRKKVPMKGVGGD